MGNMIKKPSSKNKKNVRIEENLKFNNELVVQHNNLIEARYRLSLQEKRLMLFLMSRIKPNDDSFKNIEVSISELANIMELDSKNLYREMAKVTKNMIGRVLSIRDLDKNSLLQVPWVSSAEYLYENGIINIQISEKIAPYLLKLKEQFTVIRLSDLIKFKSIYAIRIYELLKQYQPIGYRKFELDDLRMSCGILVGRLASVKDFRKKVLEISQREINEKSDIFIDFKFIKKSRKFVSVEFFIKSNSNYEKDNVIQPEDIIKIKKLTFELQTRGRIIETIKEFGFSNRLITNMIDDLSDKEIEDAIIAVKNQVERGGVLNPKAMLRTAFKEKWKPDVFSPKKLRKAKEKESRELPASNNSSSSSLREKFNSPRTILD
jgi:plasmid replication initiation protein